MHDHDNSDKSPLKVSALSPNHFLLLDCGAFKVISSQSILSVPKATYYSRYSK